MAEMEVKRFDFFSLRDFSAAKEEPIIAVEIPVVVEEPPPPPPPPPPPTFSEQQLEAACQQAREEGFKKGVDEGAERSRKADAEREAQLTAIMKKACENITVFRTEYAASIQAQQEQLTRLALAVAQHVCGATMRRTPDGAASQMVSECLPMLLAEPRIVITVHSSIITLMKNTLEEVGRQAGYDGTLILEPDDALHPADCHLQWRGGSARSSQEEIWNAIEEKLLHIPVMPDHE